MAVNGWNGCKRLDMAGHDQIWLLMAVDDWKCMEMQVTARNGRNGSIWLDMGGNGINWVDMAGNGWNIQELADNIWKFL